MTTLSASNSAAMPIKWSLACETHRIGRFPASCPGQVAPTPANRAEWLSCVRGLPGAAGAPK